MKVSLILEPGPFQKMAQPHPWHEKIAQELFPTLQKDVDSLICQGRRKSEEEKTQPS